MRFLHNSLPLVAALVVTSTSSWLSVVPVQAQATSTATDINTCTNPVVETEFGEKTYIDQFSTSTLLDSLPAPLEEGCFVAQDEAAPTTGLWIAFTVPGTSDMEYPVSIETLESYAATFAVYEGGCNGLTCVPSQAATITDGGGDMLQWNVVGGQTYHIFVTRPLDTFNVINLQINMVDSFVHCDLLAMPDTSVSDHNQTCVCVEQGGGVQIADGTSFSAPVVSGVAALVMAYFPALSAGEVRQILLDSATRYVTTTTALPGADDEEVPFGTLSSTGGVVNAAAAVRMAMERSR